MIVLHTQYIVCGRVCVWNQNLCIFFQFVSLRRHSFVCADEFVCFALSLFFCSRPLLHTLVYRHPNSLSRPFPIACLMGPFLLHPTPLNLPDIYLF